MSFWLGLMLHMLTLIPRRYLKLICYLINSWITSINEILKSMQNPEPEFERQHS